MAIRTVDFSQVSDGIAGGADTTLSAGGRHDTKVLDLSDF